MRDNSNIAINLNISDMSVTKITSYDHFTASSGVSVVDIQLFLEKQGYDVMRQLAGGHMNPVFEVGRNGSVCIAKPIKDVLSNEDRVLQEMQKYTWVPKIIDTIYLDSMPIMIIEKVEGINGRLYLDKLQNDNGVSEFAKRSAQQLFEIHTQSIPEYLTHNKKDWDAQKAKLVKKGSERIKDLGEFDRYDKLIKSLETNVASSHSVMIHGDYISKNFLVSDKTNFVLDWENTRMGSAEYDVAIYIWYAHLHNKNIAQRLTSQFASEYERLSGKKINSNILSNIILEKVSSMLGYMSDPKSIKIWSERLLWTLDVVEENKLF